uniref:Uncharacterized protein n=1 Tax=Setaria italica TaxID=4555 RepID=K4AP79_SETIT
MAQSLGFVLVEVYDIPIQSFVAENTNFRICQYKAIDFSVL